MSKIITICIFITLLLSPFCSGVELSDKNANERYHALKQQAVQALRRGESDYFEFLDELIQMDKSSMSSDERYIADWAEECILFDLGITTKIKNKSNLWELHCKRLYLKYKDVDSSDFPRNISLGFTSSDELSEKSKYYLLETFKGKKLTKSMIQVIDAGKLTEMYPDVIAFSKSEDLINSENLEFTKQDKSTILSATFFTAAKGDRQALQKLINFYKTLDVYSRTGFLKLFASIRNLDAINFYIKCLNSDEVHIIEKPHMTVFMPARSASEILFQTLRNYPMDWSNLEMCRLWVANYAGEWEIETRTYKEKVLSLTKNTASPTIEFKEIGNDLKEIISTSKKSPETDKIKSDDESNKLAFYYIISFIIMFILLRRKKIK